MTRRLSSPVSGGHFTVCFCFVGSVGALRPCRHTRPDTGCLVLTPWRTFSRGAILPSLQIPDNFSNGAVAARDAVLGNETEESLSGDPSWVDERLQARHEEPEGEA